MVREFVPGGIDGQQARALGLSLARSGAAYVAVSAGTFHSLFADPVRRFTRRAGYLGPDCADLSRELGIPVAAAGRIITPAVARRLLTAGQADLIGLGRPLQADSGWVHKARRGRPVRVCLDCNWCLRRVILDQGLGCARWPRLRLSRIDLARREMARLGSWLWILAEPDDIHRYKHQAAMLRGIAEEDSAPVRPAVLFVSDGIDPVSRGLFCQWLEGTLGLRGDPLPAPLALADRQPEALVDLVRREAFGGVVLCRDPSETWRRRLVHRPRGKVVVLLGRAAAGGPILVPVDFSEAGLLQLALVRRLLVRQPDLAVDLVHVAQGPEREVRRRWDSMRRIVHWPRDVEMAVVPPAGDIAGTLIDRARTKGCPTVVMGKRGLSGVKRLLLGSVSAAVVSGLADATVILVD